jgi:hypothetical protein
MEMIGMPSIDHQSDLDQKYQDVLDKLGKKPLSDDEIALLACREITSSYSRDEKDYR